MVKIEVWSDFTCPYCYIGKRKLEHALEKFPHSSHVMIKYKSYQLDQAAFYLPGKTFIEIIAERKGVSLDQAIQIIEQVTGQAKEVGLEYHIDTIQYTNTFDAHRLLKLGEKKGLAKELAERILYAYFTESSLLSDYDTLAALAKDVGIDEAEVFEVLTTEKYKRKVYEDIEIAEQMGVQAVPFFVFNEKYALSGIQSEEAFQQALSMVWEEEGHLFKNEPSQTTYCVGDDCDY